MHRTIFLALLAPFLVACGGAQTRPVILQTYPVQGAVLANLVREIRVEWDAPVTVLNPDSALLFTGGVQIPLVISVDPEDENSLLFRPPPNFRFLPGTCVMTLAAGFEVNGEEHYRLDPYILEFRHGTDRSVFLAVPAPASVVEIDAGDITETWTTPTPGARTPIALAGSAIGPDARMWAQLETGGGDGKALAWFRPGDALMTEVQLTHEPGGDLITGLPAFRLGGDGLTMYGAWRDTALGRVRLCAVDVRTGLEDWSLVLSPASSAVTRPLGLVPSLGSPSVDVSVETSTGSFLVRVDTANRTEVDLGPLPGVDPLPLPVGGPVSGYSNLRVVAPIGPLTADLLIVEPKTADFTPSTSTIVGAPDVLFVTLDGRWVFEGLNGYLDDRSLAIRFEDNLLNPDPRTVTADAGLATPPATRVNSITNYPGVPRVFVLFDNSVLSVIELVDNFWIQTDLDDVLAGVQGVDLSASAPNATFITFMPGALAPLD